MQRIALWMSISLALTTIAFVPTVSAWEPPQPCPTAEARSTCTPPPCLRACEPCEIINPVLCFAIAQPGNPYVDDDGRYVEVGMEYCGWYGCYRDPIVTVDTCDTNPAALVNVCSTRSDNNQEVDAYGVTFGSMPVDGPTVNTPLRYRCLVGNVGCGYYPDPSLGWTTYWVPTATPGPATYTLPAKSVSAYVEVTPLCEMGFDCRVGTEGGDVLGGLLA